MWMQKTKLGVDERLLATATYFVALFGGYVALLLMTGYILLFEENEWLKKVAVKAVAITISFSLLVTGVNLIPNVVGWLGDVAYIFNKNFGIAPLTKTISAIVSVIYIAERVLFIVLGVKALKQKDITIPLIDRLIK